MTTTSEKSSKRKVAGNHTECSSNVRITTKGQALSAKRPSPVTNSAWNSLSTLSKNKISESNGSHFKEIGKIVL